MAAKGSDNTSDKIIDKKCSACAEKNVTREAEKFCIECQDYYCIPCTDLHKSFPAMRRHKQLDKAYFSIRRLRSSLPCIPTERCQIHKTKLLDMFCSDHGEVACATCVAIDHRACQDIHSISGEINNLYNQFAADQTMKQLTSETHAEEDIKKEKQQLLQELKKQRETAIKSIIEHRKELEAQLKRLEAESIKQVDEKYKSMTKDLQSDVNVTEIHIDELKESTDKLQKSVGNKAQEFVCVKTAQKTILTASLCRSSLQQKTRDGIHFSANMEVKKYLQQFNELGQLSTYDEIFKPRTTSYEVTLQKDIVVKLKTGNYSCRITGSCFTEDGFFLFADFEKKTFNRLDMTTETINDHLNLEDRPIGVCLTSKQEAAVSMFSNTIQLVSLGNKMTTTRKLKMNHYCYGLAYIDVKLYVSDNGKSVYIHDLNGTLLHTITTHTSGEPIFSHVGHISVSTDRDCVYVADENKGVITLDLQGNYLSTFTDRDLVSCAGVCTDGRGNMFVCGYASSNIIQISEESKTKLCTMKTNSLPCSVSFDPYQNKLATTHFNRNSVTIHELF